MNFVQAHYAYILPLHYKKDLIQGQFLGEYCLFEFKVFILDCCLTKARELRLHY